MRAALTSLLVLCGCADVSGLNDYMLGTPGTASCTPVSGSFGDVRLVAELDNGDDHSDPTFSVDGLELFFSRQQTGMNGAQIVTSTRPDTSAPWGPPSGVDALNGMVLTNGPVLSWDGLTMWLTAAESFSDAFGDIYVSRRASRNAAWSTPVEVDELNTSNLDVAGGISDDELAMTLFRIVGMRRQLFESTRQSPGDAWGDARSIDELNTGDNVQPWLGRDGLSLYWSRDDRIWHATRPAREMPFEDVREMSELNRMGPAGDPWLSCDESVILFSVSDAMSRRSLYWASR